MLNRSILAFGIGLLLSSSAFSANPPRDRIPEQKAKSIALKKAPGKIQSSELEFEKKQWVYSFDILGKDNQIHEVLVNAKSGKIVASSIESPPAEAKEAKQEKAQ